MTYSKFVQKKAFNIGTEKGIECIIDNGLIDGYVVIIYDRNAKFEECDLVLNKSKIKSCYQDVFC